MFSGAGVKEMMLSSFYPVIMVEDVTATAQFYKTHFGFVPAFEADWYVHLHAPEQPNFALAILRFDHETIPQIGRSKARGMLLNFETEDVDALYARFSEAGLPIRLALRDEAFGQRHFITEDPNGVLIDVIKVIPPSAEFLVAYGMEPPAAG
jgi:uncharacterized glyoxalase superfamily protein PhnB